MAQLSLNNVFIRFLPVAGRNTSPLIGYSYLFSAGAAALLSLIFILGIDLWAPALELINTNLGWQLMFGLATITWTIFALQDSALTGLRQAVWVPLENISFALLKIVLLVALAHLIPGEGIFVSWIIPVAISLIPVNLLIWKFLIPQHQATTLNQSQPIGWRTITQYAAGNYLGSLFFLGSTTLLPLLVTNLAGATANAYFYPPWMIATGLQLVALNMTTSLTVEGSLAQSNLNAYCRRVIIQTARLLIPLAAVIFLAAPYVLLFFGQDYAAAGSPLLRWLTLGTLPNVVIALSLSLARIKNQARIVVWIQGAFCGLGLGLSALLLPHYGITGVGIAWFISQTCIALLSGLAYLRPALELARK
jgi:O-antigen/teichoic acid export membrane protein